MLQEFPGLLLSAAIVDKLGRKLSMSAMFFCCCTFLLPLLFQQSGGLTTGLLFGARICISGTFTIVYIYAPEVSEEFMSFFHRKCIFIFSVAQHYLIIKKSQRKNAFNLNVCEIEVQLTIEFQNFLLTTQKVLLNVQK